MRFFYFKVKISLCVHRSGIPKLIHNPRLPIFLFRPPQVVTCSSASVICKGLGCVCHSVCVHVCVLGWGVGGGFGLVCLDGQNQ